MTCYYYVYAYFQRLSSNKCVSCLFICFLFISLFFFYFGCVLFFAGTCVLTWTSIHFHRWIFKWLHLTTGKKGSLLSSLSWFPLAIYSTTTWRKKNAETQERKGLRSRNSKAFYLPCPYFLFFFAEFTWRICGSGNKRNALPQKPQGIVSHARLKRTGKDLAGKRHPRQATGGLRSRDPRIQRWRWRIARRQPFHLTERNSWKPLSDQ